MSKRAKIISGALLITVSLWSACYLGHVLTSRHWAAFPTVLTAMGVAVLGFIIIIFALEE